MNNVKDTFANVTKAVGVFHTEIDERKRAIASGTDYRRQLDAVLSLHGWDPSGYETALRATKREAL